MSLIPKPILRWALGKISIVVTVEGVKRTALVEPGRETATSPSPLVIFFHGLGGSSRDGVSLGIAKAWPEATVVCPQGFKIPTPEGGGGADYGWQIAPGERNDQDVRFVEALIQTISGAGTVNSTGVSGTADTAFRWDGSEWIETAITEPT